jgi:ABC-2 type transport system permease protein
MIRLVRVELMKLITTRRTTAIFLAVSAGLCLLITLLSLLASDSVDTPNDLLDVLASAQIASLVILILGAVNMGGEARHGTQVATFLATPVRWRVVVAKSIAHGIAGVVAGTLNVIMGLLCVLLFKGDTPWPAGGDILLQSLGGIGVAALYASFGVAMGALLRNQAAAVAGTLVYLLAVETILSLYISFIEDYGIGPSQAALAQAGGDHGVAQGVGGLVLLGWMLLFTAGGAYVVEKRDVRG